MWHSFFLDDSDRERQDHTSFTGSIYVLNFPKIPTKDFAPCIEKIPARFI